MSSNPIYNSILGLCIGDAIEVSASNWKVLSADTITVNIKNDIPSGTWSGITSLNLCMADSLAGGLDYNDMMAKLYGWFKRGDYGSANKALGVCSSTLINALIRYENGVLPLRCGGTREWDRDNASLIRMLPIALYLYYTYGKDITQKEYMQIIHNSSSLTNWHPVCHIACGIYVCVAIEINECTNLCKAIQQGIKKAMEYYRYCPEYNKHLGNFDLLLSSDFSNYRYIKCSLNAADTLIAVLWYLSSTNSYLHCIQKAINHDREYNQAAAIVGGLAGLYYKNEQIPKAWKDTLVKKKLIYDISNRLYTRLAK